MWVGIIVAALILWAVYYSKNKAEDGEDNVDQQVAVDTNPKDGVEDTTEGSIKAKAPTPVVPLTYAEALVTYKDFRIQLDTECRAFPNNVTYKNGTTIMIDNRAPVARNIKVGTTMSVKAWGFKLIKLSSSTLPATWLVDCGTQQNVATILIQK